ncbi:MAG: M20/M25/M40 family metallo-hydrolase [Verrucomicrobiota bacterium]
MTSKKFCHIAERLMSHPAAPFHEHAVRAEAECLCAEHGLSFERDRFGNLLVRLQTNRKVRPIVLAAHLDHPGFEIVRAVSKTRFQTRFLGGVPDDFFKPGTPIRFLPGGELGRLGKRLGKEKSFELLASKSFKSPPQFAVWELNAFQLRSGCIHGRACDDLVGVAAILATLIELQRSRARVNVIGVISRAEEVGFMGALAVAAERSLPKNALVISLETSRELPGVKMGQGVILRVGDRTSIFDSEGTRFLSEVGTALRTKDKGFQFQRALMSGGTCEATAYQEFGFQTAAVCVALGNYHNCAERNRIAAEYVSLADALSMVKLLVGAAKQMTRYSQLTGKLQVRLHGLLRQAQRKLKASA